MQRYEYQVIPAPKKGEKARGAKSPSERFAVALTNIMNRMGGDGWQYLRADTLPCEERVGLTGSKTVYQNMLVFRREVFIEAVEMLEKTTPPVAPPVLRSEPVLSAVDSDDTEDDDETLSEPEAKTAAQ